MGRWKDSRTAETRWRPGRPRALAWPAPDGRNFDGTRDLERGGAARERAGSRRGRQLLLPARIGALGFLPAQPITYHLPLERDRQLLRRRRGRTDQQGRGLVLSRAEPGGEVDRGPRSLLARGEGGALTCEAPGRI